MRTDKSFDLSLTEKIFDILVIFYYISYFLGIRLSIKNLNGPYPDYLKKMIDLGGLTLVIGPLFIGVLSLGIWLKFRNRLSVYLIGFAGTIILSVTCLCQALFLTQTYADSVFYFINFYKWILVVLTVEMIFFLYRIHHLFKDKDDKN